MGCSVTIRVLGWYCGLDEFKIGDIDAEYEDFGKKGNHDWYTPEECEENDDLNYACKDMRFTRKPPTPEVLLKYKITEDEYAAIAEQLEDVLSFGSCGYCV